MLSVREGVTTRVICVGNQKGGVGKTTNTINLAAALAERGRTSLIIDLDPSAGATKNLGAPTTGWVNAFDLLTGTDPEDCILTSEDDGITLPRGIHLVPGTETLGTLGQWLAQPDNVFRPLPALLVEPIRTLRGRYDYIWFDTPPTHTHQTTPALTVADYAIVSTKPEARSVDAIGPAVQYIMRAKEQANPKLRLLGIILNAMPGSMTRLASTLVDEVEQFAAGLEFRPYLRSKVCLLEAEKAAQTIFDYEPSGETADQYRELAAQIEERIARFESEAEALPTREIVPAASRKSARKVETAAQTTLDYEAPGEPSGEAADRQHEPAERPEERSEPSATETASVAVCETAVADPDDRPREAEQTARTIPEGEPSDASAEPQPEPAQQAEPQHEPAQEAEPQHEPAQEAEAQHEPAQEAEARIEPAQQAEAQPEPAQEAEARVEPGELESADPAAPETMPEEPEPSSWVTRLRAALARWLSRVARSLRRARA